METKYCKFCNNPVAYTPLKEMEEKFAIKIFYCYTCNAEYLFFSRNEILSQEPSSVSLYVDIGDKTYRWTVSAHGVGRLWLIGKPGIPGQKINEDMRSVILFNETDKISITPQNIEAKVRSWLTFL